jgi:phenylalanyl-tRNA synthetase beta subunit
MQFRDPDTTLRHDQVDPQVDAVVKRLSETVGAELRG